LRIPYLFVIVIVLFFSSCTDEDQRNAAENSFPFANTWYKQSNIDLGHRIIMKSPTEGVAISRGRGDIEGKVYNFISNEWVPFYTYSYSDYPQIAYSGDSLLIVHHSTRTNYQPNFLVYYKRGFSSLTLPEIMWDEKDYVMWKSMIKLRDRIFLAGQQGNIIKYEGNRWERMEGSMERDELSNLLAGDINDISFTASGIGWGVGKEGVILKFSGESWERVKSPVNTNLERIYMADENNGWIVGQSGTLLKFENGAWVTVDLGTPEHLVSVTGEGKENVWVAGSNATLYYFNGNEWKQEKSVKIFDDSFTDIAVVKEGYQNYQIWIMGNEGIYTNSRSIGFSFTDNTSQSILRRDGRAGIFLNSFSSDYPDLFVINEEGIPNLYRNNKNGTFADVTTEVGLLNAPTEVFAFAAGDINNDGYNDLFAIFNDKSYKLYLGSGEGNLIDFTEKSGLKFPRIDSYKSISAHFVDLNNDGTLDLYISNNDREEILFSNNGAGQFNEIYPGVNKELGRNSFGALLADFNNDGLVDILIPYQIPRKRKIISLFINEGDFRFKEKDDASFYLNDDNSPSATVAVSADFNNDGYMDVLLHLQKSPPMLWLNVKGERFILADSAGFTETIFHPDPSNGIINVADINNDGLEDLFISSKLYLNKGDGTFNEVSERLGISFTGNPTFADYDNDGDDDIFIGSSRRGLGKGDRAVLYRNNLNDSNYIKVFLEGGVSNRSAIGSRILLHSYNKEGELVNTTIKQAGLGSAPLTTQNLNGVKFGIKNSYRNDLEIIFPSGVKHYYSDIKNGSVLKVTEVNLLNQKITLAGKSIKRTVLLADVSLEIIRLFLVFLIIAAAVKYFSASGGSRFVKKWYYAAGLLLFYFISVHLFIMSGGIFGVIAPLLAVVIAGGASGWGASAYLKKEEAKFISHYKIDSFLGKGGMGAVYRATDIHSKKYAAVKILNDELLSDPENQKRFRNEGQLLSSFNHPHIVKVYETGEHEGKGFIAMEYLSGGTLKDYLIKNFPLSQDDISKIAFQLCDGLAEIHKNDIIHRDIKTNNIMLDEAGELRIMDFGLSKSTLVSTMTSVGTVLGTLGYVAPEQITNILVDSRTDIFSLGVVLYELAANELPFKGENEIALIHSIFNTFPTPPSQKNILITPGLDEIIMKCISKSPEARFNNTAEIAEEITKLKIK
jgi:tRNA A-37 threonylcarbamoyl transferase component Bud32